MAVAVTTLWLTQALRALPAPLIRVLDAWSYRLARRRAAKRRLAAKRPVPAGQKPKTQLD
jgi:hypothetical protein